MTRASDVLENYDQSGVQLDARHQIEEIISVIGYKDELFRQQMLEDLSVSQPSPTPMSDVIGFKTAAVCD